jgi:hypothetical protein
MKWKEPIVFVSIIGAALAIKVAVDSFALFAECATNTSHTLTECMLIGILY